MDHVFCWNCISPNFPKLSSHRTCGRPRFRKGWFVKYSAALSGGFQKVAAAGHRSRCRQTRADKRNCFLKTASPHRLIGYKRSAASSFSFIRCIVVFQSVESTATHPTIVRSIFRWVTSNRRNWDLESGSVAKPNKIVGDKTESKNLSRNFNATCLLVNTCLCLWNFAHVTCILWPNSTSARWRRSPTNVLPKYLCLLRPLNISTESPASSTCIGRLPETVVNIFVFDALSWRPMAPSSVIKSSVISFKSCKDRAYSIKSSAYLMLVVFSPAMTKPWLVNSLRFHFRIADSNTALKRIGLMTSPCLTPLWMENPCPCCNLPLWFW